MALIPYIFIAVTIFISAAATKQEAPTPPAPVENIEQIYIDQQE